MNVTEVRDRECEQDIVSGDTTQGTRVSFKYSLIFILITDTYKTRQVGRLSSSRVAYYPKR